MQKKTKQITGKRRKLKATKHHLFLLLFCFSLFVLHLNGCKMYFKQVSFHFVSFDLLISQCHSVKRTKLIKRHQLRLGNFLFDFFISSVFFFFVFSHHFHSIKRTELVWSYADSLISLKWWKNIDAKCKFICVARDMICCCFLWFFSPLRLTIFRLRSTFFCSEAKTNDNFNL